MCNNSESALTNMKPLGPIHKSRHICWRLNTQSTHTGQETHHVDSTALKWGTWFISFQRWTVMSQHRAKIQWLSASTTYYSTGLHGRLWLFYVVGGGHKSLENLNKAISSCSRTDATGSVTAQQLPPAAQHILFLCTYRQSHLHTQE